jgi:chromosome segregation ATPase
MINPLDISKVCSICELQFNCIFARRYICQFCYKGVCSGCSLQKYYNDDTRSLDRICDTCYSGFLKLPVSERNNIEKEKLSADIALIRNKIQAEKKAIGRENLIIEELQKDIHEYHQQIIDIDKDMRSDLNSLEQEVEKIEKDYQDLNSRLESVIIHNWESDFKIKALTAENQEFSTFGVDLEERINTAQEDVQELLRKINKTDPVTRKSETHAENIKIYRIKQEIINITKEKTENYTKIEKMKENQRIKNETFLMLFNKLASITKPSEEINEDTEILTTQGNEVTELKRKLTKIQRKYEIEDNKCKCEII